MRLSILLNMIVKNEAHIIEKTLTTLCDKIKFDYWVISDTGSTDNTKELITKFFEARGIKGELFDDEWKDFGHNRSKALEHAYNKTDLLFVFDADDDLVGNFVVPDFVSDSYHLHFGSGYSLNYWRVCMVNNRKKWKYVGVLHEFIECMEGPAKNVYIDGEYYITHGTGGGRSADPLKYSKDAAVLEKGFKDLDAKDPLRNRYAFYCANSYKDANEPDRAIVWYKITIGLEGGWDQEKYKSCILIYEMYKKKNKIEDAVFYALQSYKYDKTRVEGIFKLIQHYCSVEMSDIALTYYRLIEDWYENSYIKVGSPHTDKLFVEIMDYDFFLPYYMIIVSDRTKKHEIGVKMYDFIFGKKKLGPEGFITNLLFNFQFFVGHVGKRDKKFIIKAKEYLKVLEDNNIKIPESFYHNIFELSSK